MGHPLHIAFVWHMHQPFYRDLLSGDCAMPWVRLHGTKDYLDMVKLLSEFPQLHQTFNLVPSLIDQLEEYLPPVSRSDRFLDLSRKTAHELGDADKRFILEWFFMANWERMVKPSPRYHDLLAKRGSMVTEQAWPEILKRFKPQDYLDLQVWFNLAWIDPWLRAQDPELSRLEAKASHFTEAEKRRLLDKQFQILQDIVPAYRQAQRSGQVELATSPYYHPILPLLCDLRAAQTALPHLPLPHAAFRHPEDAVWHLTHALKRHEALFGTRPSGLWPPEGAVSEDVVNHAIGEKLRWIATDEEILWRTVKKPRSSSLLYRPHLVRRKAGQIAMFFRDRELSDLIGFVYSQWNPSMAIQDFLKRCEGIHQQFRAEKMPGLVTIILDGENAWEFYPRDGFEFLHGLYQALAGDGRFRLVTVSEFLDQFPPDPGQPLPELFTGSWIDANLSTWIGHPEHNAAWTHLTRARQDLVEASRAPQASSEALEKAWRSLYVAEGSDWMWWYGDRHHSLQDEEFDRLFRAHLANAYRSIGLDVPAALNLPIKTKVIRPIYEPTASMSPTIDGLDTTYYEWLYAGYLDLRKGYAAIHRSQQLLQAVYYGFDQSRSFFRLDVDQAGLNQFDAWRIQLEFPGRNVQVVAHRTAHEAVAAYASVPLSSQGDANQVAALASPQRHPLVCAYQRVLELAVPTSLLGLKPGDGFQLCVAFFHHDELLERHPTHGGFRVTVPPSDFEIQNWSV
jgi:alpha-amylase/alpha-mannosidase (GH57 family)